MIDYIIFINIIISAIFVIKFLILHSNQLVNHEEKFYFSFYGQKVIS